MNNALPDDMAFKIVLDKNVHHVVVSLIRTNFQEFLRKTKVFEENCGVLGGKVS